MAVTVRLAKGVQTPRHAYAFDLVFRVILQQEWRWADGGDPDVVYGGNVPDSGLLSGTERILTPPLNRWGPWLLPFVVGDKLDPFSFAFWMATRMEEWTSENRDVHGRFKASATWSAQQGLLERPVVDEVVLKWASGFLAPFSLRSEKPFEWWATIDLDNAFAYRHKPLYKTLGGAVRDAILGRWTQLMERGQVLLNKREDPFDTTHALMELHEKVGVQQRFFVLLADRGPHDRGVHYASEGLAQMANRIAQRTHIGLHPGYASHGNAGTIIRERLRLEEMIKQPVKTARQHYLRHDPSVAWPALVEAGIRSDWSMGFADAMGFRAGLARPFPAYDLNQECALELEVYPVMVMEATLGRYMKLPANEGTLQRVWDMGCAAEAVGGLFVTLWHNETYAGRGEWKSWRIFYQTLLEERPAALR